MATTYKTLGQYAPLATTNTDLYTVPSGKSAICSTLSVCNRGIPASFRVAIRPSGASIGVEHYIVYDAYVNQNDTVFLTLGITLAQTDVVTVYSSTANLSFSLFGTEVS